MNDQPAAAPLDTASLSEKAAARLRDEILSGRVAPGERLNLDEYRALWGVSITPLRDAVKKLEADGLVAILPRRGVFVATIDKEALFEIFEIRLALEPFVAELAAAHIPGAELDAALRAHEEAAATAGSSLRDERLAAIDHLIHDLVLRHCPNRRLARLLAGVRDSIAWCQGAVRRSVPQAFDPALDEHLRIFAALRERDGRKARAAMEAHLRETRERAARALAGIDELSFRGKD